MEHNLEKTIKYEVENEFKSLYPWSLVETEKDDKKTSKKWIPFCWSLRFIASRLTIVRKISIEKNYDVEDEKAKTLTDSSIIIANLHSGFCNDGKNLEDYVNYRMFGTDRRIESFTLKIYVASDGIEKCTAWATPSYDYEVDFKNSVESDIVEFNLFLTKERWESIEKLVQINKVDTLHVSFGDVAGFYSVWSPSIRTNSIKVLSKYHAVEGDKEIIDALSKIGDVGEFGLVAYTDKNLNAKMDKSSTSIHSIFEDEVDLKSNDFESGNEHGNTELSNGILISQISNLNVLLGSFKKILWGILILLLFILLK
jgi:hypothetical protein